MNQWRYLILSLLLIVFITGCSFKQEPAKKHEEVTLKLMVSNASLFDYEPLIAAKFPYVKLQIIDLMPVTMIDLAEADGDLLKLDQLVKERTLELIEKEKPDFYYDVDFDLLVNQAGLLDLDPLMKRDNYKPESIEVNVLSSIRDRGRGSLFGMSTSFKRNGIIVNKRLFQTLGIPEPTDGMTWDELLALAARFEGLQSEGKPVYGLSFESIYSWSYMLSQIGSGNGLQMIDETRREVLLDNPKWREIAGKLVEMDKGGTVFRGFDKSLNVESRFADQLGRTAMTIGNAMQLYELVLADAKPEDWNIITMPVDEGTLDTAEGYYANGIFSIDRDSPHSEEIWDIIRYVNSTEAAQQVASIQSLPQFLTQFQFSAFGAFSLEPFVKLKPRPSRVEEKPISKAYYSEQSKVIQEEMLKAVDGSATVDEAWDRIIERLTPLVPKYAEQ